MADSNADASGNTNTQPGSSDTLLALKHVMATSKRDRDELTQQNARILSKLNTLEQAVQTHPGLSEEGKKARIAPGKPRSCTLEAFRLF